MQKEQIASFIRLHHVFGIGRVSLIDLGEKFDGDLNHITQASRSELQAAGLNRDAIEQILNPDHAKVDRELEWAEQSGNQIICYDEEAYPALLRQTVNFPPLLYCSGNIELLASPQIAIVGSRHCTPGGAKTATDFARVLAQTGLTITSGMATGIDTQAHLGALSCGGNTIAVTGTGLDRIYPSSNRQMAYDIREKG